MSAAGQRQDSEFGLRRAQVPIDRHAVANVLDVQVDREPPRACASRNGDEGLGQVVPPGPDGRFVRRRDLPAVLDQRSLVGTTGKRLDTGRGLCQRGLKHVISHGRGAPRVPPPGLR